LRCESHGDSNESERRFTDFHFSPRFLELWSTLQGRWYQERVGRGEVPIVLISVLLMRAMRANKIEIYIFSAAVLGNEIGQ